MGSPILIVSICVGEIHQNTNFVDPTSPLLHTKSKGHWPSDSGKGLYHIRRGGHLGRVTPIHDDHLNNLSFLHPNESPYKI